MRKQHKQARTLHLITRRPLHLPASVLQVCLAALVFLLCAGALAGCGRSADPTAGSVRPKQASVQNYVAIGASDTFGVGADDPYAQNWPTDLTALLQHPVHLINLGVPGMTVHTALSAELPVALDAHPTLVTIWLAVNDLADNVPVEDYSHDLDTLLTRLQRAAPHAQIEVGNVPDLTSVPYFSKYNSVALRQQITAYNAAIANVVQRHHVILVDLSGQGYNLQEFPQYVSNDGLHPSTVGYIQIAQLFFNALQKK